MTVPQVTDAVRRRVLYIEDNPVNVRLVQKVLRLRPAVELTVADSGEAGLAAAGRDAPELILLDWRLPGIQGAAVLQALTTDPATATIPIIVFSGDSARDQVSEILRAGASGFLPKPFDLGQLLAVVDAHLG